MHDESPVADRPPRLTNHTLTRIRLERFTAFEHLDVELNAGVNVFVGANGTGKTHLLKVAYAACELTAMKPKAINEVYVHDKLVKVFLPWNGDVGRLIKRPRGDRNGTIEIRSYDRRIRIPVFDHNIKQFESIDSVDWSKETIASVFIPAKETLAHGPGFRALYAYREIHYEEIYADIVDRAYLPPLRDRTDATRGRILKDLEHAMGGRVTVEDEEFFLKMEIGELEFTLLAEGMRKLGLLWLLIRNGTLPRGSILFWDEPEANLNPTLLTVVISALLRLQRSGVQILIATHEYAVLKELELLMTEKDDVRFHALYRGSEGEVNCESADRPFKLRNSAIAEAFTSLYDREIERSLGTRVR